MRTLEQLRADETLLDRIVLEDGYVTTAMREELEEISAGIMFHEVKNMIREFNAALPASSEFEYALDSSANLVKQEKGK